MRGRESFSPSLLPPAEALHLAFLDGVRGWAAAYVVLHHAMLNLPRVAPGIESSLAAFFDHGHYAVDVFIVLSGYCLMLPVVHSGRPFAAGTFFRRRALRILPTYYLAMLMSCALIATLIGDFTGTHWDVSLPVTARDIVLHLLLLHDWVPDATAKINHPFWSVAVEWKIYFLFPLLLGLVKRWGAWRMAWIAVAGGYFAWLVLRLAHLGNTSPWGSCPYYVGLFALGMLSAEVAEKPAAFGPGLRQKAVAVCGALSLLSIALSPLKFSNGKGIPLQLMSLLIGAWAASLFVVLRIQALPWLNRLVANPASVRLGTIGYSVYLVHAPIVQLVWQYGLGPAGVPAPLNALLMLAGSMLATLLVAVPFYFLAERPFHLLSRRAFRSAAPVVASPSA